MAQHLAACAHQASTRRRRHRSQRPRAAAALTIRILDKAATTSLTVFVIRGTPGLMGRSVSHVLQAHTRTSMAHHYARCALKARIRLRKRRSRRRRAQTVPGTHIPNKAATTQAVFVIKDTPELMVLHAPPVHMRNIRTSTARLHACSAHQTHLNIQIRVPTCTTLAGG